MSMKGVVGIFVFFLATILGFWLVVAQAVDEPAPIVAQQLPDLDSKMRYYDVLKIWGNPQKKEDDTSGKGAVWSYGSDGQVVFDEGYVVAWTRPNAATAADLTGAEKVSGVGAVGEIQPEINFNRQHVVADVLGEIVNEIPAQGKE